MKQLRADEFRRMLSVIPSRTISSLHKATNLQTNNVLDLPGEWRTSYRKEFHSLYCRKYWEVELKLQENGRACSKNRSNYKCTQSSENYALLGYYTACSDNSLPTFRSNLSVLSSEVKNPKIFSP